ncbi:LolA family protein [Sulfurihydrogenibium azorense]|uniref:LolA family protein n=1 Tax=Sulfurihydrogenibium azorense TaxID=309806 RepID=UPI002409DD01|nr:outer membrane lipoprotein carrier protein LolA [Sulfurihydrogenibium azorense]MDM7273059.1 outer membrane lipoprotein carrier protein LolA [Sulfurihydrogenibium azorense]
MRFLTLILILFNLSFGQDFLTEFQKKLSEIKAFESEFTQKTYQAGFKNPDIFTGELKASKPLTIKLDYTKPYKQTIFMTKEKIILYNPQENQALITSPQNSLLITDVITIFVDNKPINKVFNIKSQQENKNYVILELIPKNGNDIKSLELTIEKNTLKLQKISAVDLDGNRIEVEFKNFKYYNTPLSLDFKLPKNVEIIRQ